MAFFTNLLGGRLQSIAQKTPLLLSRRTVGIPRGESFGGSAGYVTTHQFYHNLINKWNSGTPDSNILSSSCSCGSFRSLSSSVFTRSTNLFNQSRQVSRKDQTFKMSSEAANVNNDDTTGDKFALDKKYKGLEKNVWLV